MTNKGMLLVLSGPSGVGKDVVRTDFMAGCPTVTQSISATSRAMREGEKDGVDYHFVTREAFEDMIARGEFLEYTRYNGNYYGTPRGFVRKMLDEGKDILLKIEVEGALNVKKYFPEAVLVMLVPPSMQTLWDRLAGRGTDTYEKNLARFRTAYDELQCAPHYDYILVNDRLPQTVADLAGIYRSEKMRQKYMQEFYENLLKETINHEIPSHE